MGQGTQKTGQPRLIVGRAWQYQPFSDTPPSDEFSEDLGGLTQAKTLHKAHQKWLKQTAKSFAALHDVTPSARRIAQAIRDGETITLSGDYDCDGNCSVAIMRRFLLDAGVPDERIRVDIPNRESDGYGYNIRAADDAHTHNTELVITLDNGTKAKEAIEHSLDLGMDVVVLDHHPSSVGDWLPSGVKSAKTGAQAYCVNPGRADESDKAEPFKPLAAAGITLLMVQKIHEQFAKSGYLSPLADVNPARYTAIGALATVADVVDISGKINRSLVKFGLASVRQDAQAGKPIGQQDNPAIIAMMRDASIKQHLTSEAIAFQLAPRINAPGRLGQSIAWKLLSQRDGALIKQTQDFIKQSSDNQARKAIEAELVTQARQQIAQKYGETLPPVLFVGGEGWHEGVIGIVAGRMKEEYNRPVIAYSELEQGLAKCSARNIKVPEHQTDLGEAMRQLANEGVLLKAGGHVMAAGASFKVDSLPRFEQALHGKLGEETKRAMQHTATAVAKILPENVSKEALEQLLQEQERWQPFGEGNPRPKYVIPNMRIRDKGKNSGAHGRHLQGLKLQEYDNDREGATQFDAQAFHAGGSTLGDAIGALKSTQKRCCVLGTLERDSTTGAPLLHIEDIYVPPAHTRSSKDMITAVFGRSVANIFAKQNALQRG